MVQLSARIRVLLADDHPVVRQGLRTFLDLQDDLEVVAEAADGAEAVAKATELQPDVVLTDIVMPRMDGVEAIRRITQACPSTRVIALTSFSDDEKIFPAVRAGAAGYLLKDVHPDELAEAIRAAYRGEALLAPAVAARLMREVSGTRTPATADVLTKRELDVLRAIARGRANREIARELEVAEKTVKSHVSSILSKLGLQDRTQAALYAVREGITDEPPRR